MTDHRDELDGLRIGELFAGYGGLGMGVQAALGGRVVWYSDVCKFDDDGTVGHYEPHRGACKILAHRFPDVPNLGDVSIVDWSQVERVDVLTGGSPCQDLSHAGRRAGMTEGTRSNLWVAMREAIAQLRPSLVVWENVRGAYSAAADSAVEPCEGCVGDGSGEPALRALGRVLGDLSDLGYDCRWHGLQAAEVGAPHGRFRVFVVATDTQSNARRLGNRDRGAAPDASHDDRDRRADVGTPGGRSRCGEAPAVASDLGHERSGSARDGRTGPSHRDLLPTPRATDGTKGGPNQRGSSGDLMLPSAVAMLPTPQARDFKGYGPADAERNDPNLSAIPLLLPTPSVADSAGGHERRGGARGEELLLNGVAKAHTKGSLLPTPRTKNNENRQSEQFAGESGNFYGLLHNPERWGDYAPAIARWEQVIGRAAPGPTMTSSKGNPQLAPTFVEWMMGLPAGWVTDVPGITRNEALKALGNGVVPQQCTAALREMFAWEVAA